MPTPVCIVDSSIECLICPLPKCHCIGTPVAIILHAHWIYISSSLLTILNSILHANTSHSTLRAILSIIPSSIFTQHVHAVLTCGKSTSCLQGPYCQEPGKTSSLEETSFPLWLGGRLSHTAALPSIVALLLSLEDKYHSWVWFGDCMCKCACTTWGIVM